MDRYRLRMRISTVFTVAGLAATTIMAGGAGSAAHAGRVAPRPPGPGFCGYGHTEAWPTRYWWWRSCRAVGDRVLVDYVPGDVKRTFCVEGFQHRLLGQYHLPAGPGDSISWTRVVGTCP